MIQKEKDLRKVFLVPQNSTKEVVHKFNSRMKGGIHSKSAGHERKIRNPHSHTNKTFRNTTKTELR